MPELTREDVVWELGLAKARIKESPGGSRVVSDITYAAICTLALEALERREQSKGSAEDVADKVLYLPILRKHPAIGTEERTQVLKDATDIIQAYGERCVNESMEGVRELEKIADEATRFGWMRLRKEGEIEAAGNWDSGKVFPALYAYLKLKSSKEVKG